MNWLTDKGRWLAEHRMAVLGFAVAAGYGPGMLAPAFTLRWCLIAVGIALLARIDPFAVPSWARWTIAWVMAMAAVATTWASPDALGGYYEMMLLGILCLTFVAGANLDEIDDVMGGLAAGLAVSAFIVLWQLFPDEGRSGYLTAQKTGLFLSTEVYAEFAALLFVWGVAKADPFIVIPAIIPLAICDARVAVLAAAVGTVYAIRPRWQIVAVLAVAGVGACLAALLLTGVGKAMSADHRLIIWGATFGAWTQYGHGLGWFQASHPAEEFAHSDALQAVAEVGIAAFALLAIPIAALRKGIGSNAERAVFVAVLVEIFLSFPLHMPATGFVAALVAGRLLGCSPVVLLGRDHVGPDDERAVRWQEPGHRIGDRAGAGFGRPIPVRSVSETQGGLRAAHDRHDPVPASGA